MQNLRLTMQVFAAWLQTQVNNHPDFPKFLITYARQPDMPDRCTTILRVGAGKDVYDGFFEEVPFRMQTRGRSESVEDAELYTMLLDDILDSACKNVLIPVMRQGTAVGNIYVTDCRPVNKPKQMPITDKQSRYQFTADYMLTASKRNEEA